MAKPEKESNDEVITVFSSLGFLGFVIACFALYSAYENGQNIKKYSKQITELKTDFNNYISALRYS